MQSVLITAIAILITFPYFFLEIGRTYLAIYDLKSMLIYFGALLAVGIAVMIVNRLLKHTSGFAVAANALSPIAVVLAYVVYQRLGLFMFLITIGIAVFLGVLIGGTCNFILNRESLMRIFFEPDDKESTEASEAPKEVKKDLKYDISRILSLVFVAVLAVSAIALIISGAVDSHYSSYWKSDVQYHELHVYNSEMDGIVELDGKYWKKLSAEEKYELMKTVARRESERLGLPFVPEILFGDVSSYLYDVGYDKDSNTVTVRKSVLNSGSGYDAVRVVTFGVYMAYQDAKNELVHLLQTEDEDISKYASLTEFDRHRVNVTDTFLEEANDYSHKVESEYIRKIKCYIADPDRKYY